MSLKYRRQFRGAALAWRVGGPGFPAQHYQKESFIERKVKTISHMTHQRHRGLEGWASAVPVWVLRVRQDREAVGCVWPCLLALVWNRSSLLASGVGMSFSLLRVSLVVITPLGSRIQSVATLIFPSPQLTCPANKTPPLALEPWNLLPLSPLSPVCPPCLPGSSSLAFMGALCTCELLLGVPSVPAVLCLDLT